MPDYFHNPYHFVPVRKLVDKEHYLETKKFKSRSLNHHSLGKYTAGKYNGRIICKLTTIEPIFIGSQRIREATENSPAEIEPFELNGKPAIPASTLRGMLSSIAEAASNSALRVLENERILSYRKKMEPDKILSAIGMILYDETEKTYSLRPLALPTLSLDKKTNSYRLEEKYQKIFPKPLLKVYIGNYRNGNPDNILRDKETFSFDNPKYYYLKLKKDWQFKDGQLVVNKNWQSYLRHPRNKKKFVIGQIPVDNNFNPIPEEEYNKKSDTEKKDYVRGILRILGKQGRDDIPKNKKCELFIPYEDEDQIKSIPIPTHVIQRFNELADERAEATKKEDNPLKKHPFHPIGTSRTIKDDYSTLRLKHGDLVYFTPDETGKFIAEISFSSIWRGRVEKSPKQSATIGTFFCEVDVDLLPMHEGRTQITPAELLFGFVQKEKKTSSKDDFANLAYAGKIKISNACLDLTVNDPYIPNRKTLKILSSPKPPCPTMYFKNKNEKESYIDKSILSPDHHIPQGRKLYLHKFKEDSSPWESKNNDHMNQKVMVKLLRENISFYFHIDFQNLDAWELGLLCYSIRPTDEFRHKIGMGKPIGLGSVKIDPIGIFFIHRDKRYNEDSLFSFRYHEAWADIAELNKVPGYQRENNSVKNNSIAEKFKSLRDTFRDKMKKFYPDILNAIELIGNPAHIKFPVHTPQLSNLDVEKETFKWFVENEKKKLQYLKPIKINSKHLPELDRG